MKAIFIQDLTDNCPDIQSPEGLDVHRKVKSEKRKVKSVKRNPKQIQMLRSRIFKAKEGGFFNPPERRRSCLEEKTG